jgi:hypothetical protein
MQNNGDSERKRRCRGEIANLAMAESNDQANVVIVSRQSSAINGFRHSFRAEQDNVSGLSGGEELHTSDQNENLKQI